MNYLAKLFRADDTRKTRFHTANGYCCLHPVDFTRSLVSSALRVIAGKYSQRPWLVYSATSLITPLVSGKRVFEFGSGMSTLWFAARCQQVVSVEDNAQWYALVAERTKAIGNSKVMYADSKTAYLGAIGAAGGKFDFIVVDGSHRKECVELVRTNLNPNGIVIVDNTDVDPVLSQKVRDVFRDSEVLAIRGWVPGNLHPNETTIIRNIPT